MPEHREKYKGSFFCLLALRGAFLSLCNPVSGGVAKGLIEYLVRRSDSVTASQQHGLVAAMEYSLKEKLAGLFVKRTAIKRSTFGRQV
jgi:hypothetical protein